MKVALYACAYINMTSRVFHRKNLSNTISLGHTVIHPDGVRATSAMVRKKAINHADLHNCLTVSLEEPCLGILAVNSTLHNLILRAASNNDSILDSIFRARPPRDVQRSRPC
jgi:hypothetical protein